jgi:ubiquinone/menaquinone biosynthesis C-methylase UbiE
MDAESHKVAEHWGSPDFTHTLAEIGWMASTAVLMHINERATGDPARDWLSAWAHRYFLGPNLRVLVLGCGEGWLERAIASWSDVGQIHAIDLAAEAVERARVKAQELGVTKITYGVSDLNRDSLPGQGYDVVIAHSILHHIENLEHVYSEIDRVMKPDATLIVNEYVGPKRFQFSDEVLHIINELLRCLPPRLRRSALDGRTYEAKERPTAEFMITNDPSEAVRSDELVPLAGQRFEILDRRSLGGTLLMHLLYDIVQNFRFDDSKERSIIDLLCTFEGALVDAGAIGSDFAIFAARKRTSSVPYRAYSRPLPQRPIEASFVDPDPLGFGRRVSRRSSIGTKARLLPRWMLRLLRTALVSTKPRRANLIAERHASTAIEQLRYVLTPGVTPFDWVIGRWSAHADTSNEDDRAILALLETFERRFSSDR